MEHKVYPDFSGYLEEENVYNDSREDVWELHGYSEGPDGKIEYFCKYSLAQ